VVGVSGQGGKARGPGHRSVDALRWLSRVEVAGIEPLGRALGFGWRATYSHVQRLADAGLLERVHDREGSVVAITREGRRAVGADSGDVRVGATRGSGLRHARAVSWVAALLTLRDREWVSDHEARGLPEWQIPVIWTHHRATHRPDVGVTIVGARVAVEVELSHKAPRRLRAILAGYEHAITAGDLTGGVLYVSDRPDVLAAVKRAAACTGVPADRFRTRVLAEVHADVRRLARTGRDGADAPTRQGPKHQAAVLADGAVRGRASELR
jgi:DNA-binding transcriptional ArsR family regulator